MLALTVAIAAAATACSSGSGSGSGSTPVLIPTDQPSASVTAVPTLIAKPDISALLKEPIATPSVCHGQDGTTDGLLSPWLGTVDVSVFLKLDDSRKQIATIGRELTARPVVKRSYFESQAEAYKEFQRLYTCSAEINAAKLPASYRLVLTPGLPIAARNNFVAFAQRLAGVDLVQCPANESCVDVVRSVEPSINSN